MVLALPPVSIPGMLWLWTDTGDTAGMARHAEATFRHVPPSPLMVLPISHALRHGIGFRPALAGGCALTVARYLPIIVIAARSGVRL